jgi:predicted amidophosphoribosyltransferase
MSSIPPIVRAAAAGTAEPGTLCGPCWQKMPFIARPFCERLGTPFAIDIGGPLLSPAAIAEPPVFDRARAVALHEGDARAFVHRLKFSDRLDLAGPMGRMMAAAGPEVLEAPTRWCRCRCTGRGPLWRRFNQSAALAEEISGPEAACRWARCAPPAQSARRSRSASAGRAHRQPARAPSCAARRWRSRGGGWCWSTMCTPPGRR